MYSFDPLYLGVIVIPIPVLVYDVVGPKILEEVSENWFTLTCKMPASHKGSFDNCGIHLTPFWSLTKKYPFFPGEHTES